MRPTIDPSYVHAEIFRVGARALLARDGDKEAPKCGKMELKSMRAPL